MSDWQKVKIEFDDAEGNRISAVMWQRNNTPRFAYQNPNNSWDISFDWNTGEESRVTVTPIRELPTGLGAVIEVPTVPGDCERWVRTAEDNWASDSGRTDKPDLYFDGLNFTVLSEGVAFD